MLHAFGALHQRLASPWPAVSPPANGSSFSDVDLTFGEPASAGINFSVNHNGSWIMTKEQMAIGNPTIGSWASPAEDGVGAGFSIRVTPTLADGVDTHITITNPLAAFVTLDVNRAFSIYINLPDPGSEMAEYAIVLEIRNDATMEVFTSNFTIFVTADNTV